MILAQILIAMVVTTILSTAVIQRADIRNRTVEADNTVKEIELITEAAQKYKNDIVNSNDWPDDTNNCIGAIAELLSPSTTTYLVNIDTISPFRSMPYTTSCNTDTFTVEVESNDVFAGYIATLAGGTLTGAATPQIRTAVTVTPGSSTDQAMHERFLQLGDIGNSLTATVYDVEGNTIQQNGRNLLFIEQRTIDVTVTPRELVPIPDCTGGGIQNTPKVHLSMGTRMAAVDRKPIIGWDIFIDTANSTATNWALSALISTEDGVRPPQPGTLVVAQTYCDT